MNISMYIIYLSSVYKYLKCVFKCDIKQVLQSNNNKEFMHSLGREDDKEKLPIRNNSS